MNKQRRVFIEGDHLATCGFQEAPATPISGWQGGKGGEFRVQGFLLSK